MSRRRLKPIYDLLEAGNNKKVVQEIDKQLAKSPQQIKKDVITADDEEELTVVIGKALKSLALVRLGRAEEADTLFNELLSMNIIEDNALSVMMQYCRETQQVSKIVSFYENAVKKDPNNEDMLCSLFYAYARSQEFNKQQQTALKLFRVTNRIIYCYWQALSYVIACEDNDLLDTQLSAQQKALNLQLAERIYDKAYAESKTQDKSGMSGEAVFYVNFLEKRGQYAKALELVENLDEKRVGIINYKIKNEINILVKMANYEKCKQKLEEYLEHDSTHSDDWSYLKLYLDVCFKLNKNVADVSEYLNKLKQASNGRNKGPYLAILDLYQQKCDDNDKSVIDENALVVNLKHLIDAHHYKPGFYYDLVYFNKIIEKYGLKYSILRQVEDYLGAQLGLEYESGGSETRLDRVKQWPKKFQSIDHIYSYITYWQLYRYFDLHLSLTQQQSLDIINQLHLAYENGLEFGKELLDSTQQFSDEIIMLKLHFKYDLLRHVTSTSQKSRLLLSIINDANYALTKSKANYQLKLYLVNLYSNLGVYNHLQNNFNAMEIKNIQYYSMSYLVLYNCLRLGSYEQCSDILGLVRHFYMTNLFDTTNFMINCYKFGTFDKLFDLYKFMINVRKSLNMNICLQEKFLLKTLFNLSDSASSGLVATFQPTQASLESLAKVFDTYFHDVEVNACLVDQLDFSQQLKNDNLCDHNDRTVLQYWLSDTQADLHVNNDYKELLNEQRNLLVYRNFYVKYLHLALKSSLGQLSDVKQFDKLIENFEKFELSLKFSELKVADAASSSYTVKPVNQLLNSKSCYMEILSKNGFNHLKNVLARHLFLRVFQLKDGYFANELNEEKNKNLSLCLDELKSFFEAFKTVLNANSTTTIDAITSNSFLIEYFAVACEQLSLQGYLFTIAVFNLLQFWQERCSKKKSSKKKKQFYLDYQASVDLFYEIYEQLCSIHQFTIEYVQKAIKALNEMQVVVTKGINDEILNAILSKPNVEYSLSVDIRESYVSTFEQLKTQFEFKHKQLQQLLSL